MNIHLMFNGLSLFDVDVLVRAFLPEVCMFPTERNKVLSLTFSFTYHYINRADISHLTDM